MNKILKLKNNGRIEIKNQISDSADLCFYGDITGSTMDNFQTEDKCPQDIVDFLKGINGINNINVHLNSGGGDMFGGVAIYNILKNSGKNIISYVDAIAASATSVIAMAGNKIVMPSGAQLMIHNPLSICIGNAADMRGMADTLDQLKKSLVEIYMENANDGITEDDIKNMMDKETWMTGTEAKDIFKNIETNDMKVAASLDKSYFNRYKNIPKNLFDKIKEDKHEDKEVLDELEQLNIFTALNQ